MTREIQSAAAALALAMTMAAPLAAHASDALRVVRDRETGQLRAPTDIELQSLEKAEAQVRKPNAPARAQPVEIRYADGTVETKLDESSMMYSVASRNADGSLDMQCLPAKEAAAVVKAGKNSSAAKANAKARNDYK